MHNNILRTQKIKSRGQITQAAEHNFRLREQNNIDIISSNSTNNTNYAKNNQPYIGNDGSNSKNEKDPNRWESRENLSDSENEAEEKRPEGYFFVRYSLRMSPHGHREWSIKHLPNDLFLDALFDLITDENIASD